MTYLAPILLTVLGLVMVVFAKRTARFIYSLPLAFQRPWDQWSRPQQIFAMWMSGVVGAGFAAGGVVRLIAVVHGSK